METFEQQYYWWAGAALFTGLLTLYSMSKIWLEGFWKPHPEQLQMQVAVPLPIYMVMLAMSSLILTMGLAPDFLISFLQAHMQSDIQPHLQSQQNQFYGEYL